MIDMRLLTKFVPRWQLDNIIYHSRNRNINYHVNQLKILVEQIREMPNISLNDRLDLNKTAILHYTVNEVDDYWISDIEPVNMIGFGYSSIHQEKNN